MEQNQNSESPRARSRADGRDGGGKSVPSPVEGPASPLDFEPLILRRRHDGWTPGRQRLYLAALASSGSGRIAAARVGTTPRSVCRLARRPGAEGFARACEAACRIAAWRRRALAKARAGQAPAAPAARLFFSPLGTRTL